MDRDERGFTLIELLVVMIILGVLAGIAIPAFLAQKRKAHEASVKSDVKQVAKEVAAYYVDGTGTIVFEAGAVAGTWQLRGGSTVLVTGPFSSGNNASSSSTITSDTSYCVAIIPELEGASPWRADADGLSRGDC